MVVAGVAWVALAVAAVPTGSPVTSVKYYVVQQEGCAPGSEDRNYSWRSSLSRKVARLFD